MLRGQVGCKTWLWITVFYWLNSNQKQCSQFCMVLFFSLQTRQIKWCNSWKTMKKSLLFPSYMLSLACHVPLIRLYGCWIFQEVFPPVIILAPFLSPDNTKNIHNLDCRVSSFTNLICMIKLLCEFFLE